MRKQPLNLTPAQSMAVLKTLIERVQVRFKTGRRLTREDLCAQRAALSLADTIGPAGQARIFPAMRWNARERRKFEARRG